MQSSPAFPSVYFHEKLKILLQKFSGSPKYSLKVLHSILHIPVVQFQLLKFPQLSEQVKSFLQASNHASQSDLHIGTFVKRSFRVFFELGSTVIQGFI